MKFSLFFALVLLQMMVTGCVREQPRIIIITATFPPAQAENQEIATATQSDDREALALSPAPAQPLSIPTPNATVQTGSNQTEHAVQPGDTLSLIAARYGVDLGSLLALNALPNPDVLQVGQIIQLPQVSVGFTPNFKILPDSRIVRGPLHTLDIRSFLDQQPGYARNVQGTVDIQQDNGIPVPRTMDLAAIVDQVSIEYSVDPALLLLLLEYRAGWLSNPQPDDELIARPLASVTTAPYAEGIYYQLAWAANQINQGYYGWKYRQSSAIELPDGRRVSFSPELNPGTIALQYFFSRDSAYVQWEQAVSPNGFYRLFVQYFGDPFASQIDQVVGAGITQPLLRLPFEAGVPWRLTGGPHGGWGSGSAWASVDFAPANESPSGLSCYIADYWVTAVADGVIARSGDGAIVLDLDGDGNESTGWAILYLHTNTAETIRTGEYVVAGQRLGKPSCAGGISNATHLHIGRKFNGEWIPADCSNCPDLYTVPSFEMSGWVVVGIDGQEYQGLMRRNGIEVVAEQGWATVINLITGE
jgi:LasA protease